jgi:hypothetical protein
MGLLCAPDIANTAFDRAVESVILEVDVLRRYRVLAYFRFMDDGLILGDGERGSQLELFHQARALASAAGFHLIVESVSATECVYLDLRLKKDEEFFRTGFLNISVHRKPTSLSQPLRPSSFHPRFVHESWPQSMVVRSRRLCTNNSDFIRDSQNLRKAWEQFGIQWCEQRADPTKGPRTTLTPTCRLIVPYHKSWIKARLNRVLRTHQHRVESTLQMNVSLSVAWSLGYRHLLSCVRRGAGEYHETDNLGVFMEE